MTQKLTITYCDACGKVGHSGDFLQRREGLVHKLNKGLPRPKIPFLCAECDSKNLSNEELFKRQAKLQKIWQILKTGFEAQVQMSFEGV